MLKAIATAGFLRGLRVNIRQYENKFTITLQILCIDNDNSHDEGAYAKSDDPTIFGSLD